MLIALSRLEVRTRVRSPRVCILLGEGVQPGISRARDVQTGLFSDANLSFVLFAPSRSFLQVTRMRR